LSGKVSGASMNPARSLVLC